MGDEATQQRTSAVDGRAVAQQALSAARGWIDEAHAALEPPSAGDDAVHLARRRLARARAALRLVRSGLDPATFEREDRTARDVRRLLSPSRDAFVAVRVVRSMVSADGGAHGGIDGDAEPVLRELERMRVSVDRSFRTDRLPTALDALAHLRERADSWQLVRDDPAIVIEGASRAYRRGRRASIHAAETKSRDASHRLRKRSKELRYQYELLADAWGSGPAHAAAAFRDISDGLGAYLDLWIAADVLREAGPPARELLRAIEGRIKPARRAALALADDVYRTRPERADARLAAWVDRATLRPRSAA
jgi:hypothetical protein